MKRGQFMYEGKAKILYSTDDPKLLWVYYKDDATAGNGAKKGTIEDKGVVNAKVSSAIFRYLEENGVPNHFVGFEGERDMIVQRMTMFHVEVVMRNVAAGSLVKRVGLEEGKHLRPPLLELYLKDDALGDPLVNDEHLLLLEVATRDELEEIKTMARKVNDLLIAYFAKRGITLVDFKLEFGRPSEGGPILLADEVSPDTCRLWDSRTGKKLDKDRFRQDLGGTEEAYQEVLSRTLGAEHEG